MMSDLLLQLFGAVSVKLDGRPFKKFRTTKTQALLLYLAVEPPVAHQREALMALLWPDMPLESAQTNLRQIIYQLRKAIPETAASDGSGRVPLIFSERQTVQINPEAGIWVDAVAFSNLIRAVQKHDHSSLASCPFCRGLMEEAVSLYKGSFLADFYLDDSDAFEAWAHGRREVYRRRVIDALAVLAEDGIWRGEFGRAQKYAQRQLDQDNLDERAYRQLMEALARDGRKHEALAVYTNVIKLLRDELGMAPARQTTRLAEQIENDSLDSVEPAQGAVRGYQLLDEIGAGSFGVVHHAYQPVIGREVVIKIIRPRYANHPEFIRRFEAEAQTIARLEHPYIVPLYDYWREPDNAYLVMRWLRGGSLEERLQEGPLALDLAARITDQVAAALYSAHRRQIIHRDVRAANILLDEDNNAYLSDFSVAEDLLGDEELLTVNNSAAYLSPEQLLKEELSPQSDQYGLGILIYHMLTGSSPFSEEPTSSVLRRLILSEPLPRVALQVPGMPRSIDDVLQRATAKKPGDRFPDMISLARAFQRAVRAAGVVPVSGLTAVAGKMVEAEAAVVHNPYKGLHAFQESDADTFFGREALVERLVGRIKRDNGSRFLAVVGPSGAGKSSAVKAGLLPVLRGGAILGSQNWFITEMTPSEDPLEELAITLRDVAVDPPADLLAPLQYDERGLANVLERILPYDDNGETPQLLLLIDQFEELFTLTESQTREHFIDILLAALNDLDSRLRVIVTLRADFYDRPLQVPGLGELLRQRTEVLLPLAPAELEKAISGPATLAGVNLESGLLADITADVSDQPGALPLMQYALTELFEERKEGTMTLTAYEEIGGVTGALSRRADEIYESLNIEGQEAAQQMFLRLVTLGEGVEDTRRRVLRAELEGISIANDQLSIVNNQRDNGAELHSGISEFRIPNLINPKSEISKVIDLFGQYRLLTFDRDPLTRGPTVEVAHEALLREWPRLHEWLDESRADVRLQRLLAGETAVWQESSENAGYLLRGARLDQYSGWPEEANVSLTDEEMAFLAASFAARDQRLMEDEVRRQRELETARQLAETEKQRAEEQVAAASGLRRRAVILAGALGIAALLAIVAVFFARQSNENAMTAGQNALAAQEAANLAATREAEALDAVDAQATAQIVAEANEADAIAQRATAEAEADSRATAEAQAGADRDSALQAQSEAEHQAALTTSRELALASLINLDNDPELSILLALEALKVWHTNEAEEVLHRAVQTSRVVDAFIPHEGHTREVVYSPDGRRLATAGADALAKVWDLETGREIATFTGHADDWVFAPENNWIEEVEFTPDGSRVASIADNGMLRIWDAQTAEELLAIDADFGGDALESGGFAGTLAFSPDGKKMARGFADGSARVWDAATGEELLVLSGHGVEPSANFGVYGVGTVDFSPDSSRLATAGIDAEALTIIWDLESGEPITTLAGHTLSVNDVRFSPDGSLVATTGEEGKTYIWDADSGQRLLAINHGGISVHFMPGGAQLATAGKDGTIRIWDVANGDELIKLSGNPGGIAYFDINPDGSQLVTATSHGPVRFWNIGLTHESLIFDARHPQLAKATFSPDGQYVATTGGDEISAQIWDATYGTELLTLIGHDDQVSDIVYSSDGDLLATASVDGTTRLWDAKTGEALKVFSGHDHWVNRVAFNPDNTLLATAGQDKKVILWDVASGEALRTLEPYADGIWSLNFSPDGALLATGTGHISAKVRIWDVESGQEIPTTLEGHEWQVNDVIYSPDGSLFLTTSDDGSARIWDAETGQELVVMDAPSKVLSADFNPDGHLIVTGEEGGKIKIWDADSGNRVITLLEDGEGAISHVEFSPDGRRVLASVSGPANSTVLEFILPLEELIETAQSRVTRSLTDDECRQYLHLDACPDGS
jgi:WD40 repeat protein/DNA-binding SARP family transcriptional activator/tRNA A-37 threonylcarbamoyl transferase component Bud32